MPRYKIVHNKRWLYQVQAPTPADALVRWLADESHEPLQRGDLLSLDGMRFEVRRMPRGNPALAALDSDNRIAGGELAGVHVDDVVELSRRVREIEQIDCEANTCRRCPATFASKKVGFVALMEANPDLLAFLEGEANSSAESAFRHWLAGGRRGAKPRRARGDGRFDALNEQWDLSGAREVSTWIEAVYVTIPPTGHHGRHARWAEFEERLPVLEDATGLRIALPDPAERRRLAAEDVAECEARADALLDSLYGAARAGRLGGDVPF